MTRKPGRRFPRSLAAGLVASALLVTVPPVARGQAAAPAAPKTLGTVARLDPRFDLLIPKDAALEVLADGYAWVEGPVWDRKEKRVLFSDIPNNQVIEWSESGGARTFLKPSGYTGSEPFTGREPGSNGLTFDKEGRLVLCQHGDRRIARREADGRFTTLVDRFEGKRFNSPNDLVFSAKGDLYFTDPPYGRPGTFDDPGRELTWQGVYRLSREGKLSLLVKDLRAPNGVALSPDEKTLYVAQSDMTRAVVMAYALTPEGTVTGSRVFADLTAWKEKGPGAPDGMKVDKDGNVFTTGPGGVHVFTPQGEHLGSLLTGVPTANLAFGGDGSVLYVTANTALCRIRTLTKGIGF
jgi:gluconolactonase